MWDPTHAAGPVIFFGINDKVFMRASGVGQSDPYPNPTKKEAHKRKRPTKKRAFGTITDM
jgi:hypothetical protein